MVTWENNFTNLLFGVGVVGWHLDRWLSLGEARMGWWYGWVEIRLTTSVDISKLVSVENYKATGTNYLRLLYPIYSTPPSLVPSVPWLISRPIRSPVTLLLLFPSIQSHPFCPLKLSCLLDHFCPDDCAWLVQKFEKFLLKCLAITCKSEHSALRWMGLPPNLNFMQNFRTLGQPLLGKKKGVQKKRRRDKKKTCI